MKGGTGQVHIMEGFKQLEYWNVGMLGYGKLSNIIIGFSKDLFNEAGYSMIEARINNLQKHLLLQ